MQNRLSMGGFGVSTRFVEQEGRLIISQTQDCTPIAEDAKRRHNEGLHGSSEMRHAARIPNVIIEKYMNEHGVSFAEVIGNEQHMKRILEDPDNSMFRIWKGRI